MLILTTEASRYIQSKPEQFCMAMTEMGLLVISSIVIAGAIVAFRRAMPWTPAS